MTAIPDVVHAIQALRTRAVGLREATVRARWAITRNYLQVLLYRLVDASTPAEFGRASGHHQHRRDRRQAFEHDKPRTYQAAGWAERLDERLHLGRLDLDMVLLRPGS